MGLAGNRRRAQALLKKAREYYWYGGDDGLVVDTILAVLTASKWRAVPAWLLIMGPPGCGKTDLISRLQHPDVKALDQVSPKSLISGWRDPENPDVDPSLLAHLDKGLLILKDFTAILSMPAEQKDTVLGLLRSAYDGSAAKSLGNLGVMTYKTRFSVIAAVTPVYEHHYAVIQCLGERFVTFRFRHIDLMKIAERSLHNARKHPAGPAILGSLISDFYTNLYTPKFSKVRVGNGVECALNAVASLTALCRTHPHRSGTGSMITEKPQHEAPGRLVRQLLKIAAGRAVALGRLHVLPEDLELAKRLAQDCIPSGVVQTIQACLQLLRKGKTRVTVDDVRAESRISASSTRVQVENLEALDVLERSGMTYGFTKSFLDLRAKSGLFR